MTNYMSPEAQTSMDHRTETALINDALRAEADGTLTIEQAMLLDAMNVDEADYLAEEGGIFTEEDAREDAPNYIDETCHHGMSLWLCADPVDHYPRDGWF